MAWWGGGTTDDKPAQGRPDPFAKELDVTFATAPKEASWWGGWDSMPNAPRGAAVSSAEVPGLNLDAIKPADARKTSEVIAKAGSTKAARDPDRVYRERVLVRVYHLNKTVITRALNRNLKSYGAYHTGVEVYGREWSFGMTFDDWSTGITWNPPGENPDHTYCETLSMGYTTLSPTQVWQLIEEMKTEWRGCTYHLLSRNCHHFSDSFSQKLGVNRIPTWLNELAGTGAATVEFLDTADSGYDGGEAFFDFFSGVKKSIVGAFGGEDDEPPPRKKLPAQAPAAASQRRMERPQDPRHDPFSALR